MTLPDDAEHKYTTNGELRQFQGNTVICFIRDTAPWFFREFEWAQRRLKALPFSSKYAYVPPASFHMTVIRLIDQTHRNTALWPVRGGTGLELKVIDSEFKRAVDSIPVPTQIRMKPDGCTPVRVNLAPYDEETREGLSRYRDQVADATGLRFPGHEEYQFHVTLSYELVGLTGEERRALDPVLAEIDERLTEGPEYMVTGPPKFVVFNDMHYFSTDLATRAGC